MNRLHRCKTVRLIFCLIIIVISDIIFLAKVKCDLYPADIVEYTDRDNKSHIRNAIRHSEIRIGKPLRYILPDADCIERISIL